MIKKEATEDKQRIAKLEKHIKMLEETIKARNPNSLPMLIKATQDVASAEQDDETKKRLKFRVTQLEGEIDEKDKDFEKRLRALRQEMERMRQVYENRAANPAEAKKVNELEGEIQRTKDYYHKRIRELENKYKFKVNLGHIEEGLSDLSPKDVAAPSKTRDVMATIQSRSDTPGGESVPQVEHERVLRENQDLN